MPTSSATSVRSFGVLCALLGALGFAFKAIFIKAAYRYGVDATTLLALRMGYALPFFLAMGAYVALRQPMTLTRKDLGMLCLLGASGYYASSYLDFIGLQYISAALERLILFLYPTLVLVLSAVWLKQKIRRAILLPLGLSYLGIVLAVTHDAQFGGKNVALGSALVFASTFTYAAYLMFSGQIIQRLGSTRVSAYATTVAALLSLGQFVLLRPIHSLVQPWQVHALAIAMALFSTVLPIWLIAEAIRLIGATQASMIGTLGPILTILLAVIFLGEPLGWIQVVGAVLVIGGVWMIARMKQAPEERGTT